MSQVQVNNNNRQVVVTQTQTQSANTTSAPAVVVSDLQNQTVEVTAGAQSATVQNTVIQSVELGLPNTSKDAEIITAGPQGPQGLPGPEGPEGPAGGVNYFAELQDIDIVNVTDGSVLVYDSVAGKWVGGEETLPSEIINGGNF